MAKGQSELGWVGQEVEVVILGPTFILTKLYLSVQVALISFTGVQCPIVRTFDHF